MKGSVIKIVPASIQSAITMLITFVKDNEDADKIPQGLIEYLEQLAAKPWQEPSHNPDVVVSWCSNYRRGGNYSSSGIVKLSHYIVVTSLEMENGSPWEISFGEVLGKHSDVEAPVSEFEVSWATDMDEDEDDNDDCSRYWNVLRVLLLFFFVFVL